MNMNSRYNSLVRPTCLLLVGCFFASHAAASDPPKRRELFAQRGSIVPARLMHVNAGFPGRVTKVRVDIGDVVKAGELLAELDYTRAKLVAELAQARVELARARYQAIKAGLAEKDRQLSPGKEMLGVAEVEIKTAEAESRLAIYDIEDTTIRASGDGTVLARRVQVGDVVGSKQSNDSLPALFDLADLRRLEIVVNVPEKQMSQVFQGQQCRIVVDALPNLVYQGKVVRLSPVADAATGSFRAYIEIELPEKSPRPLLGFTTSVGFLAKD